MEPGIVVVLRRPVRHLLGDVRVSRRVKLECFVPLHHPEGGATLAAPFLLSAARCRCNEGVVSRSVLCFLVLARAEQSRRTALCRGAAAVIQASGKSLSYAVLLQAGSPPSPSFQHPPLSEPHKIQIF